jgi:hypothetical protein
MAARELRYNDLNAALFEEFPSLRDECHRKIDNCREWDPGPYVVFGTVFNDFIEESTGNSSTCSAIANFIERMSVSSDENIDQLLKIEVIPTLLKNTRTFEVYWPFCRPSTRRLLLLLAPLVAPDLQMPNSHSPDASVSGKLPSS